MARGRWHELSPWKRRPLTIPPNSLRAWIRLAVWETLDGDARVRHPRLRRRSHRHVARSHRHRLGPLALLRAPPVALPCERIVYRGGVLNAAFTSLFGVMLIVAAAWLLWELWSAVEPKPITDDFLRLLNDSFGRDWRNPLTWPWARGSGRMASRSSARP